MAQNLAPIDAYGEVAHADAEDDLPLSLRDLDFTDLYISESGHAYMQGLIDVKDPIYEIPDGAIADLDRVHLLVCRLGQNADEFTIDHDEVRYRVSKIDDEANPTYALRRAIHPIPRLRSFGINPQVHRALGHAGKRDAKGLILLTGATGQGKTTLACSLLQEYLIAYGGVAIAIEDPPELLMSGRHGQFGHCYQVPVRDGDFATPLKKAMRQKPRFIFLGEIRDAKSAADALQACVSGHVVIATTHAGSIEEAITRLMKLVSAEMDQDLARDLLAASLSVVTHQEMVRAQAADGRVERRLKLRSLFFGTDSGLRAKVREGKVHHMGTDIEAQALRVANQESPLAHLDKGIRGKGGKDK